MKDNGYKLSDNVISNIAKLLQIAILTGTDIVDNLRTLRCQVSEDSIEIHPDFEKSLAENIQKMMDEIPGQET